MSGISIVRFRPELAEAFRRLNLDWIERLFKVEGPDRKVLDDPERSIIAPGGQIFFALDGAVVIGTVAIIRSDARRFELAKMAVATTHQRRGIGRRMVEWLVESARVAGMSSIHVELRASNLPAFEFYRALGFVETFRVPGYYRGRETAVRMLRMLRYDVADRR